ncbi:MAG: hypothetical protein H6815_12690 [Phycisphaeraceae bacterium]|nr:hypothetical protein [Phycisphaerales bacterium]MCB9861299.1 hypothetical protein [Phycisphaeraceae bacterium]
MQTAGSHQQPSTPHAGPGRVNIRKLALVLVGLSFAVPLATAGVILGAMPSADPVSALAAIAPSVVGTIIGLTLLTGIRAQATSHGTFTLICLVGGASRMLSSVALALAVYLLAEPDKVPFWASFLVTGLCMLIAETVMLMSASSSQPTTSTHTYTHTDAAPSEDDAVRSFRSESGSTQRADEQAA